jgi:hypothetical protein
MPKFEKESPMLKMLVLKITIAVVALSCIQGVAADQVQPAPRDDFVRQENTVFVRPGKRPYGWTTPLRDALNSYYKPSEIKTVVFVNMGSVGRWEKVGSEVLVQRWLKEAHVTTIAVGACENYCASWFAGGVQRRLADGAFLDLKTPIDYSTKVLEPRYPNSQFAMFEREEAAPGVLPFKNIFVEAFTKGGMTGGTRFYLDKVQFCAARNPDEGCKQYDGVDAVKVGLVTDPTPATVILPDGW